MPRVERPREKMMRYGPEKLAEEELLAIILRTGAKQGFCYRQSCKDRNCSKFHNPSGQTRTPLNPN